MKIIILQENLKEALLACGKAVSTSSSLPILNSFLLKTSKGFLEVTATNLEMSITHTTRCRIEEDGEVCLQARSLQELVGNLPNETINLTLVGNILKLECGKIKTNLNTFSSADFPKVGSEDLESGFVVNSKHLAGALHGTLFAVSTNETQAELCGVCIKAGSGEMVFAGTNRYRLGEKRIPVKQFGSVQTANVIVPARVGGEIVRFCDAFDGDIKLSFEEGRMVVEVGATKVFSRLVDGVYPDYPAIIPTSFSEDIVVKKTDFLSALKTMTVFARGSEGLSFVYQGDDGVVELSASSQEAGSGQVEIPAQIKGLGGKILFNFKYLHDAVAYISSEEIRIKLNNSESPVVLEPISDEKYLYLVMPIKT